MLGWECGLSGGASGGAQPSTQLATELVGQLAHADELKTAIRDAGGLLALVRHLKAEGQREAALETVTRALTVMVINNRTNQDYIRCPPPPPPPAPPCSDPPGWWT